MINTENILEDLKTFESTHIINGTIAVASGDKMIYSQGFGYADFKAGTPCTIGTQYNIASVTKQFTAAALLRLLYDANPSLDVLQKTLQDPLSQYLPPEDYIWDGAMPEWAKRVTLHQLLTHTSGIVNYTNLDSFWDILYIAEEPIMVDLFRLFKGEDLRFEPGTRYEYSNSGYVLLGQIIERLSKKTLSQYMKETFFIPLNMTDTDLPTEGTSLTLRKTKPLSHLARGYLFDIKAPTGPYTEIKHYWPHSIDAGDGGLISTARDLIKWSTALYKGRVLPQDVLTLMLTPHQIMPEESNMFYCYGLILRKSSMGNNYTHGGSVPGYHTYPIYIPAVDMTIVSLTNVTFDISCIKDERQAIKDELSHIKDSVEKERKYNEIFSKRHPKIEKIIKQHALFKTTDFRC